MKIILMGNPIPKQRPRVVKGHTYNPQEELQEFNFWDAYGQIREQWFKMYPGFDIYSPPSTGFSLKFSFFMPIPKSWSNKKKKESYGAHHTSKPDIDNLIKWYMDVLQNALYEDDKQVHTITAEKRYINEGEEPRTEIEVI